GRYVREILSGLAAAGAVEWDHEAETFTLPPEHALFLADEDSPYDMGGWIDMVPTLMGQVDGVARATREGGGVPFSELGADIVRGIDRGTTPSHKAFLISRWLPAVPGLVDRLTDGIRVADVGCGTGTAAALIAAAFPNSRVTGFDVSAPSLEVARARAAAPNLDFVEASAESIPLEPPFDLITTFDVIHDLADPMAGLARIRAALSPDGQYLMMEPNASSRLEDNLHDRGALLYGVSTLLCMTQSLALGGEGLGAAWGREMAAEYAYRAGFGSFTPLEDITNKFSAFYLLTP
ncbi:MAG TPA: class I SAM-dependent methyltransferase, partial [Acidimicrobiia bacterium]|nr:class I SAM-dependent methyltransferase [Acidimicrobiia bacterium]